MEHRINLSSNISRARKEARLTQEDLATFLGVTKASVSKWETGQSYPDLELLPKIAAYFGLTIDELVGYEAQMPKSRIKETYARLCKELLEKPFEEVHGECRELARDYCSCYPLLTQIALLYLNHLELVEEDKRADVADEAIQLCRRVRKNAESPVIVREAQAAEAAFHLAQGNPQEVVELLSDSTEPELGCEIILAYAYQALEQPGKADEVLQAALYQSILLCVNHLAQMATLHAADHEKLVAIEDHAMKLIDAFDLDHLFVNNCAVHLTFAMAYASNGDTEAALGCLTRYERAARCLAFPLKLHGNAFFDNIEDWLEQSNPLGANMPRDDDAIRKSLVTGVSENPAFKPLSHDARFVRIVKRLEEIAS